MAEDETVSITDSMDKNLSKLREVVWCRTEEIGMLQSTVSQRVRHDSVTEQLH